MPFPQKTVYQFNGFGVPGDLFDDSPRRLVEGVLASSDAATNVIGRVFTYNTSTAATANFMNVIAGGVATKYAGILVNSKEYALYGTTVSALAPSLTLPNNITVSLLQMGRIVVVLPVNSADASNDPLVNDQVIYNTTTGALDSIKPGTALPSGYASARANVTLIDPNVPAGYTPSQTTVLAVIDVNANLYP